MRRRATVVARSAFAGLALVVVGVAAPAVLGPVAGAGTGAGSRTGALPLPDPLEPRRLEVVEQTTFVGPGSTFSVALRVEEVGDDATLAVALHEPVANRIQFGNTVGGDDLGPVVQQSDAVPVRDLPTEPASADDPGGGTDVVRLQFVVPDADTDPANPFILRAERPGVYPLAITLTDGVEVDEVVTHVVRPPDPPGEQGTAPLPLSVATLVRLEADVTLSPDGNPEITPTTAARLTEVADALAATTVPATVHTTGAVLDALVAASPDAPLAGALTGRLLQPTWTPVSITDLLAGGQRGFLDRQLITGGGSASALVGDAVDRTVWVLDAGVDPDGLTALVELGVEGVVVPESLADPLDANRFPATLTQSFTVADSTGTTVPALQTDLVLTALLNSTDQPALAANRVLADLAMLAFDFPDLQRAAVLDTGSDVDPRAVQLVLAALAPGVSGPAGTVPLFDARTIRDALTTTAPVRGGLERGWESAPPTDLGTWPGRLAATDADSASLVSTLDPTSAGTRADQIVASVNRFTLSSGEAGITPATRDRLLDDADARIADALATIGIPAQGTVTLTSDTGVVPVTLENGLPDPVKVRLRVVSDKLEFPDGDTLELTLDPGTNRREVAVRTRASGSFPVELDLRTGDDRLVIATGRLSVRSTAFSGLGLVFAVIAGVFLALWWAKHLRSTRRSRRLVDAGTGADDDAPAEPPTDTALADRQGGGAGD